MQKVDGRGSCIMNPGKDREEPRSGVHAPLACGSCEQTEIIE